MRLYRYSFPHRKLSSLGCVRQAAARQKRQAGQATVEYILMLVIAVGIAALVVRLMVSQSQDSPGFVISKWNDLVTTISGDVTDEAK